MQWFRYKYPNTLIVASANGGARDARVGAWLKQEGVLAGMPDLTVYTARHGFHALFIEFKPTPKADQKKATASTLQKDRIKKLQDEGYYAAVCWGVDEAIKLLDWYMGCETSKQKLP